MKESELLLNFGSAMEGLRNSLKGLQDFLNSPEFKLFIQRARKMAQHLAVIIRESGHRLVGQSGIVSNVSESSEAKKGKVRAYQQRTNAYLSEPAKLPKVSASQLNIMAKDKIAHKLLIFVCSPDNAETAVGDLLENYEKIAARQSKAISNIWFSWELSLLFIAKARKRIVKATLGPLLDKFFKPNL